MCGCSLSPGHNSETCRCSCHGPRSGPHEAPPEPPKPQRKIIQISTATQLGGHYGGPNVIITALCDDNTLWQKGRPMNNDNGEWHRVTPSLPQDGDAPRPRHAT